MTCDQAFDAAYDAGYFDKDEQGWVSRPIRVTTRGELVDVEDNGHLTTYRLGRRYPATGFVALDPVAERYPSWCLFDVPSRRLVSSPLDRMRSVTRQRPRAPGPMSEHPLLDVLAACVAATRLLLPELTSPAEAPTLADIAALLARPDASLRLDVPGTYLQVWRRDGAVAGASARTASPVGDPYASVWLSDTDQSICVAGAAIDALEAPFAAAREVLGWS